VADLVVTVPRDADWTPAHRLGLFIGTEGAASLAASTPPGGTKVAEVPAAPVGVLGAAPVEGEVIAIRHRYQPADVCSTLPLGVAVRDLAGNWGDKTETVVQLSDPPRGARNLRVESTGNAFEARLIWSASPHV
jgi:hypothetical protein